MTQRFGRISMRVCFGSGAFVGDSSFLAIQRNARDANEAGGGTGGGALRRMVVAPAHSIWPMIAGSGFMN